MKGKLGAGVFLDEKNAYWQYSLLLKALARKVCPDDMQHGVTRMEMILFSIADRHIAQEIVDSMIAQHG